MYMENGKSEEAADKAAVAIGLIIPEYTMVHIGGIPVILTQRIEVSANAHNAGLIAEALKEQRKSKYDA